MTDAEIARYRQEQGQTLEQALQFGRWFVHASNGRLHWSPMPDGALLIKPEEFARLIREPGAVPVRLLPEIIAAALERLGDYTQTSQGSGKTAP